MGNKKSTCSSILMGAVLLGIVLAACDNEKTKTYTVGVINAVSNRVKGTLFYNSISSLSIKLLKSVPLHPASRLLKSRDIAFPFNGDD